MRRGLRPAVAPSGLSSASARCAHPPEKGFYCPFCRRGSQRRAQFSWTDNSYAYARSCARLFPPSKWAGLFPSAANRRSAPPQVARGGLNQCKLQCRGIAWMVLQSRRTGLFFFCGWRYPYANNVAWDTSIIGFLQRKRPAGFHIHAGLFSEP